jgi:hypothetical protein
VVKPPDVPDETSRFIGAPDGSISGSRMPALALGVFVYFVYRQSRDPWHTVPWESRLLPSQITMSIIEISV